MSKINDAADAVVGLEMRRTKADLQFIAWRDFLVYCIGETEVLLRFERETGIRVLQQLFLEVLQPEAVTSVPVLKQFIVWVTTTYWGEDDAPVEYHTRIK